MEIANISIKFQIEKEVWEKITEKCLGQGMNKTSFSKFVAEALTEKLDRENKNAN